MNKIFTINLGYGIAVVAAPDKEEAYMCAKHYFDQLLPGRLLSYEEEKDFIIEEKGYSVNGPVGVISTYYE